MSQQSTTANKNHQVRSRKISIDNVQKGNVKIALQLQDEQFGVYKIPLGHTRSIPKENNFGEMPNLLMPLELKRYTFPEATGAKAQPADVEEVLSDRIYHLYEDNLRPNGFVYVFVNDHLWREVKTFSQGTFRDVNLCEFKGVDVRPATGQVLRYLTVPYKINKKVQKIEIAFSEIQWSWAYINALGGLASDDPRRNTHRNQEPTNSQDLNRQLSSGLPKPDRVKRLQDITTKLADWQRIKFDATPTKPGDPKPSNTDWVKIKRLDFVVTLYVHDPIGIARNMANDVSTTVYDMLITKIAARTNANYTIATLAQQLLAAKPKYKKYVDVEKIQNDLKWDTYIKTLKRIDATTQSLGDYLLMPECGSTEQGMCVATAMTDYWAQTDERYLQGLNTLSTLLNNMQMNEGLPRLEKLLATPHPLTKPLFSPNRDQLEVLVQNSLNAAADVLQHIAGVAAKNNIIHAKVFNYLNLLILQVSERQYHLTSINVDCDKLLTQIDKSHLHIHRSLSWSGEIYKVPKKTIHVDVELWQVVKTSENVENYRTPIGKSIEWLGEHELLVKIGVSGLFAVLEAINLAKAITKLNENKRNIIEISVSIALMIGATLEFYKELKKRTFIKRGLSGAVLSAEKESVGIVKVHSFTFTFLGNAIGVALNIFDAWVAYKQGNDSLATSSSVGAIGSIDLTIISALEDVAELEKMQMLDRLFTTRLIGPAAEKIADIALRAEGKAFAIELLGIEEISLLGILSVIGWAIIIISLALEIIFAKSPLEKWLIHGPFGKNSHERFLPPDQGGTDEWASWKNPVNAQRALMNLLYGFIVEADFFPPNEEAETVKVLVRFPLLIPGKSQFYFQLDEKTFGNPNEAYQPLSITDKNINYLISDGVSTLKIQHTCKKGQFRLRAFLDVYGNGTLLIPYVFEDKREQHRPKQVIFHIPLLMPVNRIHS